MKPQMAKDVLKTSMKARLPIIFTGKPGVGKTDVVKSATTELDYDLILSHPVVEDPTDAKGLPWPNAEKGEAIFLPFGHLAKAMKAKRPTVWFLDDLGQATPAVQAAYMQLLLARQVNGHVLPDCVTFVAATNRRQDRAGVSGILEPVKSRFASIIGIEADLNEWCKWAFHHKMPSALIAFMRFRGDELLHKFEPSVELVNTPSPRTWANLGKLHQCDYPLESRYEVYSGAVGSAAAAEFLAFIELMEDIPNPDALLLSPDTALIPEKPSVLCALISALTHRVNPSNFGRYLTYAQRLHDSEKGEFAALMVRDAIRDCPAVQKTDDFTRMIVSDMGKNLIA